MLSRALHPRSGRFPRFRAAAALLALTLAPAFAQTGAFNDDFSGPTLDLTKWTPTAISYSHAGMVAQSGGSVMITSDPNDPKVGGSRFGILSNAVFGKDATIEAALDSWDGVNAILRLQGRNGAFVEWAIDGNADTPLHLWRSYPDDDKNWAGGKGLVAPVTLGVARAGDTLQLYTITGGTKTVQTSTPVAGLGDAFRVFLYGFAASNTTWSDFKATGALATGILSGTVTGPGAAGARVSVGDTLFQPVIADAGGKYSMPLLAGSYTVTASNLGSTPGTAPATVTGGQTATVNPALKTALNPPVYDEFDGTTLDLSRWTPVTVEGQGLATFTEKNSELIIDGGDIQSWRRQGMMSTKPFDANWSVAKFKLDPNPNMEPWHPFVDLWDGAGIPNWNNQPHVEVEFDPGSNRMIFHGGRAPFVSQEADREMFYPFDPANLPATLSVVRTGNTFDFYIRGKNDAADQLAFTQTTGNLASSHRIVVYTFTPDPQGTTHNTTTWDTIWASNPVKTGTVAGQVTANGMPVPAAGVFIKSGNNTVTTTADIGGAYSQNVNPGAFTATAVAYGFERSMPFAGTLDLGATAQAPFVLQQSSLYPPPVYDDFKAASLDTTKWTPASEAGTGTGTTAPANGEMVLIGPGPNNRWGIRTTKKFSAAASIAEVTVNQVEGFGPGGLNAILQLYTGSGAFTNFIEFGIETLAANGNPVLHVWGPESGDYAAPAPSGFPITLTVVRHGNDLDFFANHLWFYSVTTKRLVGDHNVVLYGYGSSVAHFGPFSAASGTPPPAFILGDVSGDSAVDLKDAVLALQMSVGLLMPTPLQSLAGDVNHDGKLDVKDVTLILQHAVGLIAKFPGQ